MRFLLLSMIGLFLAACSGAPSKTYSYTPPASSGGRMCTSQCQMSDDYCRQGCDETFRRCVATVQKQALRDYKQYQADIRAAGVQDDISLRDFENYKPCNDAQASCYNACESKHGACYSNCGGTVEVTKSCSPFCF